MLYRKVLIPVITAALFITAVGSVASVLTPGRDGEAMAAALIGTVLAAIWRGGARRFFPVTLLAATLVSLAMSLGDMSSLSHGAETFFISFAPLYLSAFGGWLIFQEREPWPVAVIAAIAVLAHANVSRQYEASFPLFVAAVLVLVVAVYARDVRRFWRALPTAGCGFALVALSWQLPVFRAGTSGPELSLATGISNAAPASTSALLNLTGTFHPSNLELYVVSQQGSSTPVYWESSVLDRFDGHTWNLSAGLQRSLRAGGLLMPASLTQMNDVRSAFVQVLSPTSEIISPGIPVAVGLPSLATYAPGGVSTVELRAGSTLPEGTVYNIAATSTLDAPLDPSQRQLYLQLPSEPSRVDSLAGALTHSLRSPLGKAISIESFLRDSGQFQYDPNTGSPSDQDAVDAFLFQTRRGYCAQFASAFAVLARESGLPTRLVLGYNAGEATGSDTHVLRARDAHSWDQVYLPGRGWETFDPTPGFTGSSSTSGTTVGGQSSIRPKFPRLPPATGQRLRPTTGSGGKTTRTRPHALTSRVGVLVVAGGSSALVLLALVAAYALRPRSVGELYGSLARREAAARTPFEFAERFRGTAQYADIALLARLHAQHIYGGQSIEPETARGAWRAWLRVMRRRFLRR